MSLYHVGPDLLADRADHSHHQLLHWDLHPLHLQGISRLLWLRRYSLILSLFLFFILISLFFIFSIFLTPIFFSTSSTQSSSLLIESCFFFRFYHVGEHGSRFSRRNFLLCFCHFLPCCHWHPGWSQHLRRPGGKSAIIGLRDPYERIQTSLVTPRHLNTTHQSSGNS